MPLEGTPWLRVVEILLGSGLVAAAFAFVYNERQKLHNERQKRRDLWVSTFTSAKQSAYTDLAESLFQYVRNAETLLRLKEVEGSASRREIAWALMFAGGMDDPDEVVEAMENEESPLQLDYEDLRDEVSRTLSWAYKEQSDIREEIEFKAAIAEMASPRVDCERLIREFFIAFDEITMESWEEYSEEERRRRVRNIRELRKKVEKILLADIKRDYELPDLPSDPLG